MNKLIESIQVYWEREFYLSRCVDQPDLDPTVLNALY